MTGGYPIVLDVRKRLIVVIGGGAVAARKVRGLLESGATRVRVVSPAFHPEMPKEVERIASVYRPEHLNGASLVFATTDSPDVNDAIVRDAAKIGALVCRADADEANAGDFSTPAMIRNGPVLIAVSTGGSPALSAVVRDRIEAAIDPRWKDLAEAMQVLRPKMRQALSPARKREAFQQLCSDVAMDELSRGGLEGLRSWLSARFPELND